MKYSVPVQSSGHQEAGPLAHPAARRALYFMVVRGWFILSAYRMVGGFDSIPAS